MTDQDHDRNKHLDELLDSALATYASAEPGPGLETRILAKVREAAGTTASPSHNWRWLWAGAVTVVAVLVIALLMGRRSPVPRPTNDIVHTQPPAASAPPVNGSVPVTTTKNAMNHRPTHEPSLRQNTGLALNQRPSVFPTPTPLSEQEKLLLSYYARTPREELIAQSHPEEPPVVAEDQTEIAVPNLIFVPQKSSNTR